MLVFNQLKNSKVRGQEVKDIQFFSSYDVIIIGGGTSGIMAALYLSKKNKKILIIEKMNSLGGIHTHAMFHYYMGACGGLYEVIDKEIAELEKALPIVPTYGSQPFIRKYVYEKELLSNKNVTIYYSSVITGVYMESSLVKGIQCLHKNHLLNIQAKYFIDASSEAVLCQMTKESLSFGRLCDHSCQPFSNVRIYYHLQNKQIEINNIDAGYINQHNIEEYAKKILSSLSNSTYKKHSSNEITLGVSPLLGIREGYTIKGRKQLTLKTIKDNIESNEVLYYSIANLDNHTKDVAFESDDMCDWIVALSLWSAKLSIPIVKENMIPLTSDNVIVCGRCIAMDHDIASHTRMMRDCQKSGEVAGILINQSIDLKKIPSNLRYSDLYPELVQNQCLTENNNIGIEDNPPLEIQFKLHFPKTKEEFIHQMQSDRPGFAMLWAYQEKNTAMLMDGLKSTNKNLQINSAIVLGMLGQKDGINQLLDAALSRDTYLPKTSKSYNTLRGISAIYILGKIGNQEIANQLLEMLKDNQSFLEDHITFNKFIGHKEDYRFQYVSHIVRSVLSISKKYNDITLIDKINEIINDKNFHVYCTLKYNTNELHEMTATLKQYVNWKINKEGKNNA